MGDTCSARPHLLERFARRWSEVAAGVVEPALLQLAGAGLRLRTSGPPGAPPLEPLADGVRTHLRLAAELAEDTARVALAFREADGGGRHGRLTAVSEAAFGWAFDGERRLRGAHHGTMTPAEAARFERGVHLGRQLLRLGGREWWVASGSWPLPSPPIGGVEQVRALAAAMRRYRHDPLVLNGLFDSLGPGGAVEAMTAVRRMAGALPGEARSLALSLASMLGQYLTDVASAAGGLPRARRPGIDTWASTFASGKPSPELVGAIATYAAATTVPAAVAAAMLDTALAFEPFGAPPRGGIDDILDGARTRTTTDPLGTVLAMVSRSGVASAVLGSSSRVDDLLSPDRLLTEAAAEAYVALLDQPRLDLLANPDDHLAAAAVANFVAGCGRRGAVVHQLAGRAFARLVIEFPASLATYGTGLADTAGRGVLADVLGDADRDAHDLVDFVAAARMADNDEFDPELRLTKARGLAWTGDAPSFPAPPPPPPGRHSWNHAIDAALGAAAFGALRGAVTLRADGDTRRAGRAAAMGANAEAALVRSGVRRRLVDGRRHDATARDDAAGRRFALDLAVEIGGAVSGGAALVAADLALSVPVLSDFVDRLLGGDRGEAARACSMAPAAADVLRAGNEAVAIVAAVDAGVVDVVVLPSPLHSDPADPASPLVSMAELATPARGPARAEALATLRRTPGFADDLDTMGTALDNVDEADCVG